MIQADVKDEKDIGTNDFIRIINEKNLDNAATLQNQGQLSTYAANTILDFEETNGKSSHSTAITNTFCLSYKDTAYESLYKATHARTGPAMTAQGVRSSHKFTTTGPSCSDYC